MSASSVLQQRAPFLTENLEVIRLLQRRVAGESFGISWIHEVDAYSAAPEDLVRGREHAPGTDQGDGKDMAWYFCSPAKYHGTAQAGSTRRRWRKVYGAGKKFWHSEAGKRPVLDADGLTFGYTRTLTYSTKIKKSPDAKSSSKRIGLGWGMTEFQLEPQQDGADQLVLCRLYKSPRADQAASTAARSASQEAPPPIERNPLSDHDTVPVYSKICESEAAIVKKDDAAAEGEARHGEKAATVFTVVMKFGGSSVASAERMRKVADLILSFREETPVVIFSAMGETTTNLLLAGEKAVSCGIEEASEIRELSEIKQLHLTTIHELGLDGSIVSDLLEDLEQHLFGMKKPTLGRRDHLVTFGGRMSTRIFSAYLNKHGKKARKYDDFITTDDNADILEATYLDIAKRLGGDCIDDPAMPIVADFLGEGWESCAGTTFGRGGSDLIATTIGRALGSREIQVWKDVDGVMTCDPKICANAIRVPYLTFDEATELPCFGAQAMQLAKESGITVTVKNSCDPEAPGTVITRTRDMSKSELTSIALKSNITMLDIVSTRMLRQYDFLAKVFSILKDSGTSVDCVATSEGKISFTQAPSKLSSPELIHQELSNIVEELKKIAAVHVLQQRSIISLIGNIEMSSIILEKAFNVLRGLDVNVQMVSPGASKVMNVSLVVHDDKAKECVQALHSAFFENGCSSEVEGMDLGKNGYPTPLNSSAASKKYTPGGETAVPSCAERAKTEEDPAPCSVPRQTDEEEDIQRDDSTPMLDDLDVLVSSKEMRSCVQGGEPDMRRSAPGAVTEEDAGTGFSWTDHERMAPFGDILYSVPAECSTAMPCPASAATCGDELLSTSGYKTWDATDNGLYDLDLTFLEHDNVSFGVSLKNGSSIPVNSSAAASSGSKRKAADNHLEGPPSVRQERTDTDGRVLEEIEGWLLSDDVPVGVDDGGAQADFYFSPGILEVQDEQQGLTEAAEEGSGLRTEEEALPPELNPEELLGVSSSEMPWLAPALASASWESELHVAEECQTSGCGLCVAEAAGLKLVPEL